MRMLFFTVTVSLAALSCDACKPTTGARPAAAPADAPPAAAGIYPFWTSEQLPDGPPDRLEELPLAAASASLVAAGYLLTSTENMGGIADDPGADPTVHILVHRTWYRGRYVDRDHDLRVALIRADVPGRPFGLRKGRLEPSKVVTVIASKLGPSTELSTDAYQRCERPPRLATTGLADGTPAFPLCSEGRVLFLSGGAFLDGDGSMDGVQVEPMGAEAGVGPDARRLREYLDTYFASWGSAVRPKPAY